MSERSTYDVFAGSGEADPVDRAEQEAAVVDEAPDDEALVGTRPGGPRDDVDEADYLEQLEEVRVDDDAYAEDDL